MPVVLPALLCNYFGQGAALLARGDAVRDNPYTDLLHGAWIHPMVALATAATIVASPT